MAAGDFFVFDQHLLDGGKKVNDLELDTFKFALIRGVAGGGVDPSVADAAPHWNGVGSTNYKTSEVTPGGNYTADGIILTTNSWSLQASQIVKLDFDNVQILKNAANPTNAEWAIVFNNTDANKRCMGYLDLGGVKDLSAGDFNYTIPATNGLYRIGVGTIP